LVKNPLYRPKTYFQIKFIPLEYPKKKKEDSLSFEISCLEKEGRLGVMKKSSWLTDWDRVRPTVCLVSQEITLK
jgi:hypothetical protein